jgi:hypothetical protein
MLQDAIIEAKRLEDLEAMNRIWKGKGRKDKWKENILWQRL